MYIRQCIIMVSYLNDVTCRQSNFHNVCKVRETERDRETERRREGEREGGREGGRERESTHHDVHGSLGHDRVKARRCLQLLVTDSCVAMEELHILLVVLLRHVTQYVGQCCLDQGIGAQDLH